MGLVHYRSGAILKALGGRVAHPRWVAYGSETFANWLLSHNDPDVFERVHTHMMDIVDKLELAGPLAGARLVTKLKGFEGLGEARYNDPTGAYRAFFKFGRLGSQPVVLLGDGDKKTNPDFPQSRYKTANRRLDAQMARFGIAFARDW